MKAAVRLIGIVALLGAYVMMIGCTSIESTKTRDIGENATILIMPPHDVTQRGVPHPVGVGSGRQLQKLVAQEIESLSNANVILFSPHKEMNHTTEIYVADAIAEARKLNADLMLLLALGEFRDAAPMTFRNDFVTLAKGVLIDVRTEEEIWSLDRPLVMSQPNLANYHEIIGYIAESVAESIID